MADEDTIEEQMAKLSDSELLKALNATLQKRQTPPTPDEPQAEPADDYESYFREARRRG